MKVKNGSPAASLAMILKMRSGNVVSVCIPGTPISMPIQRRTAAGANEKATGKLISKNTTSPVNTRGPDS